MSLSLHKLIEGQTLSRAEARAALTGLSTGEYNDSQASAFMTVYLMRDIRVEELEGFRDAMMELCLRVDLSQWDTVDVCGTGGDGKNTFNISTAAAVVAAGAGVPVAKHGNYAASSTAGSSDVLASLGCAFSADPERLKRSLEASNLCFLHAPLFHPALARAAPLRRALGVKTFFNMLGPLVNPASPPCRVAGVYSLALARLYTYLYQAQNLRFAIVYSLDGYDEASLTSIFRLITHSSEALLAPEALGLKGVEASAIAGEATPKAAAQRLARILEGKGAEAERSVTIANAGLAIATARDTTLEEGIALATQSLDGGGARQTLKRFLEINQ